MSPTAATARRRRRGPQPTRRRSRLVGGLIALFGGLLVFSDNAAASRRLIVRFDPAARADQRVEARSRAGAVALKALALPGAEAVLAEDPAGALRALRRDPSVRYAEVDERVAVTTAAPNDPAFSSLWGLSNTGQTINGQPGTPGQDIRALDAWDRTRGAGATVAVLDTGADLTIGDLATNAWTNPAEIPGNGIDDDADGKVDDVHGWSFVTDTTNISDDNGHGTHVSGTAVAAADNRSGIVGVAPQARLLTVKVLDGSGSGYVSAVADGFDYAAREGAQVVNASLSGTTDSTYLRDAISRHPDVMLVTAAGNDAANVEQTPHYPCSYTLSNVVCVAASTNTGGLASFSDFGATSVDLGAPGQDIRSWTPGGGLVYMSGTSMASPHVAGAVALAKALAPSATPSAIRSALIASARPTADMAGRTVAGGTLDASALLSLISGQAAASMPLPTITSIPTIAGEPVIGQTLTAQGGSFQDATSTTWSWQSCSPQGDDCQTLTSATEPTLILGPELSGRTLRAALNGSNEAGTRQAFSTLTGSVSAPVLPSSPSPTADQPTETLSPSTLIWPTRDAVPRQALRPSTIRLLIVRRTHPRGRTALRVAGTSSTAGRLTVRVCAPGAARSCATMRGRSRQGSWTSTVALGPRLRSAPALLVTATLRPLAHEASAIARRRVRTP
ncbi:S8 family peptidase [Baekduia soli]|uniref:S8 family peptidase n=1 Tax=Baekduia soli TaxID=496014 RepID=UPI00165243F1|nr:S8 family peptidase [Baekduia soli]